MDLAMDFLILASAQVCLGELHIPRLILCLALLSGCTLAVMALGNDYARYLHVPLLLLCSAAVNGDARPARIAQCAACMMCLCASGAGFMLLGGPLCAFTGTAMLAMLVRRSRNLCFRWNIEVEVRKDGIAERFPALIDTGNRLREHGSGLPVLIVEAEAAPGIARLADQMDGRQKRSIPFGVLGGSGEICCFRCDEMFILGPGKCRQAAPPCCMAVYPGRIPGGTRALAPPEFALAVQDMDYGGIVNRLRRGIYGIFKCKAVHLRLGGTDSQGFGLLHRRQ